MKAVSEGMSASAAALGFADLPTTATFAPTPLVEAYFNKVSAPQKRLFVIERARHFALATHPAEVIAALTQTVH